MKPTVIQYDDLTVWPVDDGDAAVEAKLFQVKVPVNDHGTYGRLRLTTAQAKQLIHLLQIIVDDKPAA